MANNKKDSEEDELQASKSKVEEEVVKYKINNLNTMFLPPVFMLIAGATALFICLAKGYELRSMLLILFISMLVFAIIGTIIKSIVDMFDMHMDYEDFLQEDEELVRKDSDE